MDAKINYDAENDILYFYLDEKSVDFSIDYDRIILDVKGNKIVGVEVMDASERFANVDSETAQLKEALGSIKQAFMKVDYGVNSFGVKIGFISSVPEYSREGMLIQVPIKRDMMVDA
jgi:uncharacterized protein YuzE